MSVAPGSADLLTAMVTGAVALVLLRALVHKLSAFGYFVAIVAQYRLLPRRTAPGAAVVLIAAEALAVIGLLQPATHFAGALLAAALFAIYAIAMTINLRRGRVEIECGCGGSGQALSGWLVARNVVLIAGCASIAYHGAPLDLTHAGMLAAAAGVVVIWLLLLIFDQVLGNHSHARLTTHSHLHVELKK